MSVNNRGKKILLVDDDQALRTVLSEQLDLYDGFTTIQVGTAAEGMEKAKLAHYDAILLDIGLPDMDGRELCKLMRRQGVRAPVIMLTAADSDADTILGLESGANDYVTKPFRINVLLARLRAHLRQLRFHDHRRHHRSRLHHDTSRHHRWRYRLPSLPPR